MIDSKIIISVTIVLIIGAIAAGYQITSNPKILWQPTNPDDTNLPPSGSGGGAGGSGASNGGGDNSAGASGSSSASNINSESNGGYSVSPSEAQNIAQQYVEEEGATTGTPHLVTIAGKPVYVVPIEKDGKIIGEIHIDPKTGENIGGAGGAPS